MTVVVVATAAGAAGMAGLLWWWVGGPSWRSGLPTSPPDRHLGGWGRGGRALGAVGVGLLAAVLTGWPVAAVLGAAAALVAPTMWGHSEASRMADREEAVASWVEMLRDTLHASVGLSQAITATAPVAPPPVRPAVTALSARLAAGVPVERALRALADDLSDPVVDVVVCALSLAVSAQAQRLTELLGALAVATRADVVLRRRVEAGRASTRSSVRIVVAFTLTFVAGLAILAHAYLAPFGSPAGQVVLAVVGGCDATGLWLLAKMAKPVPAPRLLAPVAGGAA